jgi:hypothetical protein
MPRAVPTPGISYEEIAMDSLPMGTREGFILALKALCRIFLGQEIIILRALQLSQDDV